MASKHIIQDARELPLEKVFKEHYAVPEFQRPYVWKKQQVQQLFFDLFEAHAERGRGEYFIGSLVTYQSQRRNYLVDGPAANADFDRSLCRSKGPAVGVERERERFLL